VIRTVNLFTQGNVGYTGSLVGHVRLVGYYHGSIDGVSGNGTRRAIHEYERAHGLPGDGKIGQQLLTTIGLG
jgi:peptidoglycan hydrolase-like protein with peptidoglycan-binding domain